MLQTKMRRGNDTEESIVCRFKRGPVEDNGLKGRSLIVEKAEWIEKYDM